MLAEERRQRIRELVQARHHMKISDLSKLLGVSEMTVHRDVNVLAQEGIIMKTFGGITLVRDEPREAAHPDECVFCHRKMDERLSYRLILTNHMVESACCAHCGIYRHVQLGDKVLQAICCDFLSHATVSAHLAWFVMDSAIDIHCCSPQLLPFGRRDYAEGFVRGFGGTILSFEEAVHRIGADSRCGGCNNQSS